MEAAKPIQAHGGILPQGFREGFATGLLGTRFVKAGRDPGVRLPTMLDGFEALEVPTPLDDLVSGGEDPNEPERVHLGER